MEYLRTQEHQTSTIDVDVTKRITQLERDVQLSLKESEIQSIAESLKDVQMAQKNLGFKLE